MIGLIWSLMILAGILWACISGNVEMVTGVIFKQALDGFQTSLQLTAIIAVWFGLSRIAEKAGILPTLARLVTPFLRPLFPGIPRGHSSLGSISLNITANILGLADAATPFGLKAMKQLQELNPCRETITPAMTTFLALNSTAATMVPVTAIALRSNAGATAPSLVILPAAMASLTATAAVLLLDARLRRKSY